MKTRRLGKTDAQVSEFIFGCGNIGGIMIYGNEDTRKITVEKALNLGINWFDTAASYGDGKSEQNLGAILKNIKKKPYISTKIFIDPDKTRDIPGQVERILHESLLRLNIDHIDLIQLHNGIEKEDNERSLSTQNVLGGSGAISTMEKMRDQGLVKWIGITALGDSYLCKRAIESGRLDTAQVYFNMINPTAAHAKPRHSSSQMIQKKSTGQDFTGVFHTCEEFDVGIIAIRTLAAGILATKERHGRESIITKGNTLADDERKAHGVHELLGEQFGTKAQTALRYALSFDQLSCVNFAASDFIQFVEGVEATVMGSLPADIIKTLDQLYDRDFINH
jgi:L-galactose dehydrogenase/L-glyceraldehyde 3-phosphate reductase